MLSLLSRIPAYWGFRYLGRPRLLPVNLTLSVTKHCNSRCRTCHIWETAKDTGDDLAVDEYDRIFQSLGTTPYWVTLSGGEPFIRDDLADVCRSLYYHCRPAIVNIPTNGLLTERIPRMVKDILAGLGAETKLVVNLSLDGIEDAHDDIRGVAGNFEKAMATYRELAAIEHTNLVLGVHTVISRYNVAAVPDIYRFVDEQLKPDQYITEIAENRVELGTLDDDLTPSVADYEKAIGFLSAEIRKKRHRGLARITEAFRLEYYAMVKRLLREQRRPIACYAGYASGQVSSAGDVWGCCIEARSMGNLREEGYDFPKVWFSKEGDDLRRHVRHDGCFCPLANASYTNMLLSPSMLARVAGRLLTT